MKVRCLNCGLVLEKCLSLKCVCPECGVSNWGVIIEGSEEKIDKESLEMIEDLIRMRDIAKKWVENWENLKKQEDLIRDPLKEQREAKEEGLAFEIFEYFNGKKVKVRKIYLNGHIEGFEGDPCIVNHIYPKIMALKGLLQQMNRDYRDLIERHLLADLPIDPIELSKFYQAHLERIMDIKI